LADLVTAVRLPTGAHRRAAGTDAVTDLLIFRRRETDDPHRDIEYVEWDKAVPLKIDGHEVAINELFATHPHLVLGALTVGHGMYGSTTLNVQHSDLTHVADHLGAVLDEHVRAARDEGLGVTERTHAAPALAQPVAGTGEQLWDGHISTTNGGAFTTHQQGVIEPLTVPQSQQSELQIGR